MNAVGWFEIYVSDLERVKSGGKIQLPQFSIGLHFTSQSDLKKEESCLGS